MISNNPLDQINNLFRVLLRVHKSLLDFQKLATETFEQKKYTPYEMLQLAFNHPEFAWLRKISVIMSEMDEATSDKKNLPTEIQLKDFAKRLNDIFSENSQDHDFKYRLDIALGRDPKLSSEVSELRAMLLSFL